MNTQDSAENPGRRIGLIGLPDLAETLSGCGLQVVTGPDFRAAATAIVTESKTVGAFPIILDDMPAPGLRAWVRHLQQKTTVQVAVVRNTENPVLTAEEITEIHFPATINSILASVGVAPLEGPAGTRVFPEAAEEPAPVGIDLPDLSFFADDEPTPAVQEIPAAFEPAAAVVEADPFGEPASQVASAAVADEWDTPAAVAAVAPAPTPVAPAVQSAAPLDEWDTPAVVAAPAAPVADEWDTPAVQPAPVEYPQPGSRRAARAAAQAQQAPVQPAPEHAAPVTAPAPAPAPVAPAPQPVAEEWDSPYQAMTPAPAMAPVQAAPPEFNDWDTLSAPQSSPLEAPREFVQAPAGTPAWPSAPVAPIIEDSSGIFDDFEASRLIGTGRTTAGLGAFVINYSGKGGVGKSTTSLQMATIAAEAGLRVVLIDGNSGQGDLRTYLHLNRTNLPTMYDAAIGSIKDAILTPATINANRKENLGEIKFAFIGAPPDDINDPSVVTDALYRDVIHFARRNADLVIMDTQIVESSDRTGVVHQLLLPALVQDAWGVGIADMSTVGVDNLNNRLRKFINEGVPTSRLMVLVNHVHPEQLEIAEKASGYFRNLGTFLGVVEADISIKHDMNAGRINAHNPQMRAVIAKALLRITGNDAFRESAEYQPSANVKQGLFSRLLGKKAA